MTCVWIRKTAVLALVLALVALDVIAWGAPLDRGVVREVVRSRTAHVRGCYEEGLARDPTLAGTVEVRWTIGPDGAVEEVAIGRATRADDGVLACIQDEVARWRFPSRAGGGVTHVTYPFTFKTSKAAPER